MKELEYPFELDTFKKKNMTILENKLRKDYVKLIPVKIAVVGGSTTYNICKYLKLFLLNHGIDATIYESEYNKYYEDICFPNEKLDCFKPDIIYIHTSFRNIEKQNYPMVTDDLTLINSKLDGVYNHFQAVWEAAKSKYNCPIIQNNFELPPYRLLGNRDAVDPHGLTNFVNKLNERLYNYAANHSNFYIHDILFEEADYGISKWADVYAYNMYKYFCALQAIPYTSFQVSNIIKSIYGKNKKALALDMDNTLWAGVIGDDGPENIEIGPETALGETFAEFQEYIKRLKDMGVILTISSKNDEEVALKGLERPDSVLKKEDFIKKEINWEPKNLNIIKMAKDINILPESFVFVDDNPSERHIVREGIKGISVPKVSIPESYIYTIDRNGYFESTILTDDDIKRNQMYQANEMRKEAQSTFDNYEDYLRSLGMKAEIKAFAPEYLNRIAQLTNKSNQFNLTTKRYTLDEIKNEANDQNKITLYGKLIDKFGDNGVVSIIIGNKKNDELHIDLWLMSCRVLKRDMEFAMMDELERIAKENGIKKIYGYYYPTAKNKMVQNFYEIQGFTKIEEIDDSTKWEYKIPDFQTCRTNVIKIN